MMMNKDRTLILTAKTLIWAFFLLIFCRLVENAYVRLDTPVRPYMVYAIIGPAMVVVGLMFVSWRELWRDKWFFLNFTALVVIGALMYRGETYGPSFGQQLSEPATRPSQISYVVWPALNFLAGLGLFLLARSGRFRATFTNATIASLCLLVLTMEADMWWFAVFGDPNGRAAGLARNANEAAISCNVLACLLLPSSDKSTHRFAPYALVITTAAVLLSQSKSGFICVAVLMAIAAFARVFSGDNFRGIAAIVAVFVFTVVFSPVLNPSPEMLEAIRRAQSQSQGDVSVLDEPVSLNDRMRSRLSFDESAALRRDALKFFYNSAKDNWSGYGTGSTNQFRTGPHNQWLKLAVDEGILAALFYTALFGSCLFAARRYRDWRLLASTLVLLIASVFSHNILVSPAAIIGLFIALGLCVAPRSEVTV